MAGNPLISVIVPIYQVERYLDTCVGSIVNQTYHNMEIILVDDGSPDACPRLCDAWAAKDPRIKVVHKTNGGLSSARNAAIELMTGDYVSFVDSDDFILPNMLKTQLKDITEHLSSIAVCGSTIMSENGKKVLGYHPVPERDYQPDQAVEELLYGTNNIPNTAWGKLYDASLFRGINPLRFPDGLNSEDYYFNAIAYHRSKSVYVNPQRLYYYRRRSGSITTNGEIGPHTFDKIAIAKLTNDQLKSENYRNPNALAFHLMNRTFDTLYRLCELGASSELIYRYAKELRDTAGGVYPDPKISTQRKIKIWCFGHFPKGYYCANRLFSKSAQ